MTEVKEFKETIKDKFKEIIREKGEKYEQVRLWTQDETRIGLMPIHRKRITGKAIRPLISSEIKREYGYLFGMIEPLTGKDFMMEMPSLETATMQVFINEFEQEDPESLHLILVDNASPHTTEKLTVGENIVLIFLPAN